MKPFPTPSACSAHSKHDHQVAQSLMIVNNMAEQFRVVCQSPAEIVRYDYVDIWMSCDCFLT